MSNDQQIRIDITGSSDGFSRAAKEAEGDLDRLGGSLKTVASAVEAAFVGVGIGAFASKLTGVQRQFDVLNSSLVTMTGSAENSAVAFAAIQDFAATTPFSLAEVTGAFVKLKALGLDPSQRALESYGNTASAMGKSLNQFIEAVADASTGEFERLKEFGIKASQSGDTVKMTFQGMTTSIANNAGSITEYLTKIGENQFAGAMAERAKTLDGAISNLADSWDNLFLTISQKQAGGVIFDSVQLASGAVSDLTKIVQAMSGAADENAKSTGAMAAIQSGLGTTFETVAVLGANVVYVLKMTGNEIGGLAAQAAAVARGDFSGAKFIGQQMAIDAAAARREVDLLSERILGARSAAAAAAPSLDSLSKGAGNLGTNAGSASKEAAKLFDDLSKSAQEYLAQLQQEEGANKKLTESDRLRIKAQQDLSAVQYARIKPLLDTVAAEEQVNEARKNAIKYDEEMRKAASKDLADAEKNLESERSRVETIGLTRAEQERLAASKLNLAAAAKEEQAAMLEAAAAYAGPLHDAYLSAADAAKKQAEAMRETASLKVTAAYKEGIVEASKAAQTMASDINRSLTDAIMRGSKSGLDYAKNYARTLVLRPSIEWVMSPVSNAVAGVFSGGGVGQPAGAMNIMPAGTTAGSGGNPMGAISAVNTLANGNAGFSQAYMSAASSSWGQSLGLSTKTAADFVGPSQYYNAAGQGYNLTSAGSTLQSALPYLPAVVSLAQGNYWGAAGSAIGAYFGGPIGSIAGNIIGNLVGSLFGDSGPKHEREIAHGSKDATVYEDSKAYVDSVFGRYGYVDGGTKYADGKTLSQTLSVASMADAQMARFLRLSGSQIDEVKSRLSTQSSSYMAENMSDADAVKNLVWEHLRTALEVADPALLKLINDFNLTGTDAMSAAEKIVNLRDSFDLLKLDPKAVTKDLIDTAGGLDSLTNQVTAYTQSFYSDSERQAMTMDANRKALNAFFDDLKSPVPASALEYRSRVQEAVANGDYKLATSLLNLSSTFSQVSTAINNLTANALNAYASLTSAQGDGAKAGGATSTIGVINDNAAQEKLAASFGIDRSKLDQFLTENGGLAASAAKYWQNLSTVQQAAVTEAVSTRAAYIQAVRGQFDAQLQIVRDYAGKVQALKGFSTTLANDIAGIQIAAGQLDSKTWLDGQIVTAKRALSDLERNGAGVEELLSTAGALRDLTLQRYQIELDGQTKLKEFATATRDYLAALKVGDKSPLALVDRLAEAASQYQNTLTKAGAGDDHARSLLTGQADTWLGLAKEYGMDAWASAYSQVQSGLAPLADVPELTDSATATALGVKSAVTALGDLKTKTDTWGSAQSRLLDQAVRDLAPISSKLDQLGAGGAIASAIRDLPAALASLIGGNTRYVMPDESGGIKSIASAPSSTPSASGYAAAVSAVSTANASNAASNFAAAIAAGASVSQIAAAWNAQTGAGVTTDQMISWAHENKIPGFDVGINSVPNDMLAVIHKDERILPAADNRELFARLSSPETNYRVIAEGMAAMRAELAALRNQLAQAEQSQANRDHAQLMATKRVESAVTDVEGVLKV